MLYISGEVPEIGDLVTDGVNRSGTIIRFISSNAQAVIVEWENGIVGINCRPETLTLIRPSLSKLGIPSELTPH